MKLRLFLVRNQAAILVLCALLQRMPVVKHLIQFEKALSAPLANLIRSATVTAASLGGFHGIAGATTFNINPATPATAKVGENFQMVFAITGTPEPARSWGLIGSLPPGLSIVDMTDGILNNGVGSLIGIPTLPGNFSFSLQPWDRNNLSGDTTTPIVINILVEAVALPPTIASEPLSISVLPGNRAQFFFSFDGGGTVQWAKDGQAIDGATGASLVIDTALVSDAGSYTATVSNEAGQATTTPATLTVTEGISSKLVNLSNLTAVGTARPITSPGFVIAGNAAKTVLVRGIGPELAGFGVGDFLADPQITVFRGTSPFASNDDWQVGTDAARLEAAMNQVAPGLPLADQSKSSAVLLTLAPGGYSAQVSGVNGAIGSLLFEVYEVD